MRNPKARFELATAMTLLALGLAGCGSSGGSTTTGGSAGASTSSAQTPGIAVPAAIKSKGALTVAMEIDYPPFEFFKANTQIPQGFDVALADALAHQLGVKAELKNATFDSIIPGLAAGRYDIAISAIFDTAIREKVVTFVEYASGAVLFLVRKGTHPNLSPQTLCGLTYGDAVGSSDIPWIQARSAECQKAGKAPITIKLVPSSADELLDLRTGRTDFAAASGPVAEYAVKHDPSLEISGKPVFETPGASPVYLGVAIPKTNTQLIKSVEAALGHLIENGTYAQIAKKWGVDCCEVTKPMLNAGH